MSPQFKELKNDKKNDLSVEINIIKAAKRFIFVLNSNATECFKCLMLYKTLFDTNI